MFGFRIVKTDLRSKLEEELSQARAERDWIIQHAAVPTQKEQLKEALVKIEFIKKMLN